jgi:hypothetical protein
VKTIVYGTCADGAGIIQHRSTTSENLPGGGMRVEQRTTLEHEPASVYAAVHPAPMPLNFGHEEPIGQIIALRRAHDRLYVVAETDLEPSELQALAGKDGLKFSTGTDNLRGQALRITEISLVREAATIGLPTVSWYKLDVTKGNAPDWVRAELERAETRVEQRSRRQGELRVHDLGEVPDVYEHRGSEHLQVEHSRHPGRIISVEGRPPQL